mgnify:CR=1 FL=1
MNGWQIAMTIILAADVGMAIALHGQIQERKYNAWVSLISAAIMFDILWGGGFFR